MPRLSRGAASGRTKAQVFQGLYLLYSIVILKQLNKSDSEGLLYVLLKCIYQRKLSNHK